MTKQELRRQARDKRYRQLWPLLPKYSINDTCGGDKNKSAVELAELYNEIHKENLSPYVVGSMLRILKERGYTDSEDHYVSNKYKITFWWRIDCKDIDAFLNGLR